MKILHLSSAHQKLINRKSKNMCENKNVLIEWKCFEVHATDYKIYENRFKYWINYNNNRCMF